MAKQNVKKFLALYLTPVTVLAEWAKTDPVERQDAEKKMKDEWDRWMAAHSQMVISTEAAGATKRVSSDGISDIKNDIMLCAFVEAESHEAASRAFLDHPHLQIPQSSIEIIEVRSLDGA